MHWVIDQIIAEPAAELLVTALTEAGSRYTLVKKPPFADHVFKADDTAKPVRFEIYGPVFVHGSTAMLPISENQAWSPGYIDAPGLDDCLAHWGDHMLNSDVQTGPIGTVAAPRHPFFIRPVRDGKTFPGSIIDPADFDGWRARLLAGDGHTALQPDTPVAIASLKTIRQEFRCLIVDGELVTASRYKVGRRVSVRPGLPDPVASFVRARRNGRRGAPWSWTSLKRISECGSSRPTRCRRQASTRWTWTAT
ncbi:MAG: hypothetical protein JWR80_5999 [Bradyrhizobium sp.]|nr:hypothetical protein [Bradyrhizobium sp.]